MKLLDAEHVRIVQQEMVGLANSLVLRLCHLSLDFCNPHLADQAIQLRQHIAAASLF